MTTDEPVVGRIEPATFPDGSIHWLETNKRPLRDSEGRIMGVLGTWQDITERRQRELDLRLRNDVLAALAYTAKELLQAADWRQGIQPTLKALGEAFRVSRVFVFERCRNSAGADCVSQRAEWAAPGIPPQIDDPDLQNMDLARVGFVSWQASMSAGQPVATLVKDLPEAERAFLESKGVVSVVIYPIQGDGEWRGFIGFDECFVERQWSEAELNALRTASGLLGAAMVRTRSAAALRDSEIFLQMSQHAGQCGSWEWDLGTNGVRWSEVMCRIHGLEPTQFPGTLEAAVAFIHPDDQPDVREGMAILLETHRFRDTEYRIIRRNGEERKLWGRGQILFDSAGHAVRVIGTSTDITERKRAEEERRRLEAQILHAQKLESLGVLAGGIAHDFNNLLTAVLGYANLALVNLPDESPACPMLQ